MRGSVWGAFNAVLNHSNDVQNNCNDVLKTPSEVWGGSSISWVRARSILRFSTEDSITVKFNHETGCNTSQIRVFTPRFDYSTQFSPKLHLGPHPPTVLVSEGKDQEGNSHWN
jgi:hypothetical protein